MILLILFLNFIAAALCAAGYSKGTMFVTLSSAQQQGVNAPVSPDKYGVNLGHRNPSDYSWIAYLKYLGVKRARFFGVGGPAPSKVLKTTTNSLSNTAVSLLD